MTDINRRLVFAGQDDCRVEEVAAPLPRPTEVRVRNSASLVSAGTELAVLRRRHRAFAAGGEAAKEYRYPFFPGYAAVGVVDEVGSRVTHLKAGDVVWHPSPHETISCVAEIECRLVPSALAAEDAVFFGLVQIAMTAIRRAPAVFGETVLVSGLGLVGMLVGCLYRSSGARVAGADFSAGRRSRATALGFTPVIDLTSGTLVDWYRSNAHDLPDVAVEAAGVEANITQCLQVARPNGRVVLQGSPRNAMEIDPYTDIHRKGLTVIGAWDGTVEEEIRQRDVPLIFELCAGALDLASLRTHMIDLADAPGLYDQLEQALDEYLAVVITY